ncbi:MAG: BTB/POZ domain-containing protein [Pontimonas sp.]
MESPSDILDTLDDCVIVCGTTDRVRVRANTYVLVQACDVFKMAYEDMLENTDSEREFSAPNVSGRIMQLLVNLLHKKISASDITSIDDLLDLFEAQRYLACSYKRQRLLNQCWELVRHLDASRESFRTMVRTAGFLLESHPREFLSKARVVSRLRYAVFKTLFTEVDMTPSLARTCMQECMAHVSPIVLMDTLRKATEPGLRFQTVLECLTVYRGGGYFHPEEYLLGLEMLQECRNSSRLEIPPYVLDLTRGVLDSCKDVNTPACQAKTGGSLITIQGKPRASFFLHIKKQHCKVRLQFQHNVATIHRDGDVLEARFLLGKLGDYAHAVDEAHVRITYLEDQDGSPAYGDTVEEWIHVTRVDHDDHDAIDIRDRYDRHHTATHPVRYIRIDLFWLHHPVDM